MDWRIRIVCSYAVTLRGFSWQKDGFGIWFVMIFATPSDGDIVLSYSKAMAKAYNILFFVVVLLSDSLSECAGSWKKNWHLKTVL